jgi:hypothetical protein
LSYSAHLPRGMAVPPGHAARNLPTWLGPYEFVKGLASENPWSNHFCRRGQVWSKERGR